MIMTEQTISAEPISRPPQAVGQTDTESKALTGFHWNGRNAIYAGLLVLIVSLSVFWLFTQDLNPTTNDAQVDGHTIVVSPRVSGYVSKMNIDDNTVVEPGDVMIQLDPADYQARVDQARAALSVAEAKAASLKIIVPFTTGTTTSATAASDAQVTGAAADLDRAT